MKKKRVNLTEAGEALLPYARELYQQTMHAEMFLRKFREEMLRIGVALTLSTTITKVTGIFKKLFPHIKVKIREGPTYQIVEEISNLLHDLTVVADLDYGTPALETIKVSGEHKILFVASPTDPLSQQDELDLTTFNGHSLILPAEKSVSRAILLNLLEKQNIEPAIIAEVDNIEATKNLVIIGQGVALLLENNIVDELCDGTLKALPFKEEVRIRMSVLVHRDNPLNNIGNQFVYLLSEA